MCDEESFVVLDSSSNSLNTYKLEMEESSKASAIKVIEKEEGLTGYEKVNDMAESVCLGGIHSVSLKATALSPFPNINGPLKTKDYFEKLHNLITSNVEMKETLRITNQEMSDWILRTKKSKEFYAKQVKDLENTIKILGEECIVLQRKLFEKKGQIEKLEKSRLQENEQLKQNHYTDEIQGLKKSLISFKELYKNAQVDIELLRNNEFNKSKLLSDYETKIRVLTEEMKVLQIQVETYQKDFETERESRQNMVGERDQLLVELQKLQKSSQGLVEKTKLPEDICESKSYQEKKCMSLNNCESQIYQRVVYSCPLCSVEVKTLVGLQSHVEACLDGNN